VTGNRGTYISGLGKVKGEVRILLDVEKILSVQERARVLDGTASEE